MGFDVATELKSQINDENDPARRNMLMLLLGVLEANIAGLVTHLRLDGPDRAALLALFQSWIAADHRPRPGLCFSPG